MNAFLYTGSQAFQLFRKLTETKLAIVFWNKVLMKGEKMIVELKQTYANQFHIFD